MSFDLPPQSKEFIVALLKSSKEFKPTCDRVVKRIAEQCASDVRRKILSQSFPNARVSDAWLKRKAKQGLDPRTLVATKEYVLSIQAQKVEPGVWGVVCNDMDLMKRLEYGTSRGSPPREHWRPVLIDYENRFGDLFSAGVLHDLFGG